MDAVQDLRAPSRASVRSEPVSSCGWCGAAVASPRSDAGFDVARCERCGCGSTLPLPSPADLQHAYGDWYRPKNGRFVGGGDRILERLRAWNVARLVDRRARPGTVLDVGCGDGSLLDAFARRGRRGVGLERESNRPDVLAGAVTEVSGEFAAIVFWHSLEHLEDPRSAFRHAALLLADGGILVIAVPNLASLQSKAFGGRWLHRDLPRHLTHLTPDALVHAAGDEGLTVLGVSHLRGGQVVFGWLHGLVALLPGRPDLYRAIRRTNAQEGLTPSGSRWLALVAAVGLLPLAALLAGVEVIARRGGTVCLVARRGA